MSKPPITLPPADGAVSDAPAERPEKPKSKHKSQNRPQPVVVRKPRSEREGEPPREETGFGRKHPSRRPDRSASRPPRDGAGGGGGGGGYRGRPDRGRDGDRPPREGRSFDGKPRGPKPDGWKPRPPRDDAGGGGGGGYRGRPDRGRDGDRPPREGRSFDGKPRGPRPDGWKPRPPRDDAGGGGGGGYRGRPDRGRDGDRPPREGRSFDGKPRGPKPDGWKPRPPRDDAGGGGGGGGGGYRGRPDRGRDGDRPPREGRPFENKHRGTKPDGWKPRPPRDDARDERKAAPVRPPREETPRTDGERPLGNDKSSDKFLRVAGLNAVLSLFAAAPERIQRLFYSDEQRHHVGAVAQALAQAHKPYRQVEDEELAKIAGTVLHGGVVALADPKPVAVLDIAAAREWAAAGEAIVILDGIGNPHNLGAIARTAAFFGVKRMVISADPRQALPSGAAYRVAQGGLDHIEVYRADDIAAAITELKAAYLVVGTAPVNATPLPSLARDARPLALVLGNEEEGVPASTLAACEQVVLVPGRGAVQSLNVAASAAILVHALMG